MTIDTLAAHIATLLDWAQPAIVVWACIVVLLASLACWFAATAVQCSPFSPFGQPETLSAEEQAMVRARQQQELAAAWAKECIPIKQPEPNRRGPLSAGAGCAEPCRLAACDAGPGCARRKAGGKVLQLERLTQAERDFIRFGARMDAEADHAAGTIRRNPMQRNTRSAGVWATEYAHRMEGLRSAAVKPAQA